MSTGNKLEQEVADSKVMAEAPNSHARDNEIARRAYELYFEGGCLDGRDLDDWLKAEREVLGDAD
jgi:hypothetical protein